MLVMTLVNGYPAQDTRNSDRVKDEVSPITSCLVVDTSHTDNRMNGSRQ